MQTRIDRLILPVLCSCLGLFVEDAIGQPAEPARLSANRQRFALPGRLRISVPPSLPKASAVVGAVAVAGDGAGDPKGFKVTFPTVPPSAAPSPTPNTASGADADISEGYVMKDPSLEDQLPPEKEDEEVVDFPEPVTFKDPAWKEAQRSLDVAVGEINKMREEKGESRLKRLRLMHAWEYVANDKPAWKLCAELHIDHETEYVLLGTQVTWAGKEVINLVYPMEPVLPHETVPELLIKGWKEPDSDERSKFHCDPDNAALLQKGSEHYQKLGLIRGFSTIRFRPRLPAANVTALLATLPGSFSFRVSYPQCAFPVQDQGDCGSCYAFAGAAMAGERLCRRKMQGHAALLAERAGKRFARRARPTPAWNLAKDPIQRPQKELMAALLQWRARPTGELIFNATGARTRPLRGQLVSARGTPPLALPQVDQGGGPEGVMPNQWLIVTLAAIKGDQSQPMPFATFNQGALQSGVPPGDIEMYFGLFDMDESKTLTIGERWYAVLDLDIDGDLSATDFKKWDAAGDNVVTIADLTSRAPALPSIFASPGLAAMVGLLDKDRDGSISLPEWEAWMPAVKIAPEYTIPLSQQELVSCGSADRQEYATPYCLRGPGGVKLTKYTQGCTGATLFNTAMYMHRFGLPERTCAPYTAGDDTPMGEAGADLESAAIPQLCKKLEVKSCHIKRMHNRLGLPFRLEMSEYAAIQQAIYEEGPVMAAVDIWTYFMNKYKPPTLATAYPDGVYVLNKAVEKFIGGHAAIIHGWGQSPAGVSFWEGRNSWGTSWGNVGMFRVLMKDSGVLKEVLYAGAGHEDHTDNSPCIRIEQNGGSKSCTFRNKCDDSVRSFKYSYLGVEHNCGRWTSTLPSLYPGAEFTVPDALFCQIIEDKEIKKFDSTSYFKDLSAKYKPYPCVLMNTWTGEGTRHVCCGTQCATGPLNSPVAFEEIFCSDSACLHEGDGSRRYEKTV